MPLWTSRLFPGSSWVDRTDEPTGLPRSGRDAEPEPVRHLVNSHAGTMRYDEVILGILGSHLQDRGSPLKPDHDAQVTDDNRLIDALFAQYCGAWMGPSSRCLTFMPARYCREPNGGEAGTDALALGLQTVWHEAGRAGVVAVGRKTWTTSSGEHGVFERCECPLGLAAAGSVDPVPDLQAVIGAPQP